MYSSLLNYYLITRMRPTKMHVVDVPNDGNCFFHTIAHYTGKTHESVRSDSVDFLKAHLDSYRDVLPEHYNIDELYVNGMWNTDVMDIIPQVVSDMYKIPISILTKIGNQMRFIHINRKYYKLFKFSDTVWSTNVIYIVLERNHYKIVQQVPISIVATDTHIERCRVYLNDKKRLCKHTNIKGLLVCTSHKNKLDRLRDAQ